MCWFKIHTCVVCIKWELQLYILCLPLSVTSALQDNGKFPLVLIPQKMSSLHKVDRNWPDIIS